MSISSVSPNSNAVTATQAFRAQQETNKVQQPTRDAKPGNNPDEPAEPQAAVSKPVVNHNGQTIGTIVNVTA
jgi:hypothetical protein